jgi:exodeoxyribonuclease VII large subunit
MELRSMSSVWSVHELTIYIKNLLENDDTLREVWVRGEISNFKHHSRGHMYFTLKDANARIFAVMFQSFNRFLRFAPKDGLKVIVRGEVSLYERDGQYQLYVKEMQPDGLGNLYLAFEQLKQRLEQEGLFNPIHKKRLPTFPKKIAVITSPTGAAIRDIITTIRRRFPLVQLLVVPVLVQGEQAPLSIVRGLSLANQLDDIDLIILGRGGGSIEELWAFNDERVARSIFASNIPIISAVGHETDFTIADFVADVRAATPTGAAELAVPHIREIREMLQSLRIRLNSSLNHMVLTRKQQVANLKRSPYLKKPLDYIKQYEQRLDHLTDLLKRFPKIYPQQMMKQVSHLQKRLQQTNFASTIRNEREKIAGLQRRLNHLNRKLMEEKKTRLGYLLHQLDALSPIAVLKRGYTLTFNKDQQVITSIQQLAPGDFISVQFFDGTVEATIWGLREENKWQNNKI